MANFASTFRDEVNRLARRETRQQVEPLKKSNAQLRRTVAALRKEISELQKSVSFLESREKQRLEEPPAPDEGKQVRFSPTWVKGDRQRLGLSAKDYGRLVGVSALTIYSWENGKSKPRAEKLAAWAEIRGIGKREARRRLDLLTGATGS